MNDDMSHEIASTVRGPADAPPVVLIHGVVHQQHAWDPIVDALARRWRVITLDLPGHGASAPIEPGPGLLPRLLDATEAAVAELCPGERPHLVGNSLGGYLALEIAARGGARGVTALSPAGFFRNDREVDHALRVFRLLRAVAKPLAPMAPQLSRSAVGRSVMFGAFGSRPWRYSPENMAVDAAGLAANTFLDEIGDLEFVFGPQRDRNLPITVGWGTRDIVLLPWQRHEVARRFPQAKVVPLRGLGHVPMSDDPERILELVSADAQRSAQREARLDGLG